MMEARTDTTKGNGRARASGAGRGKPQGRMDSDKQPAVTRPQVIMERIDELVKLQKKAIDAADVAKEAISKAAEDSGYLASTVNKLVRAKVGEKFEEKHREVEQQAELFDEVAK